MAIRRERLTDRKVAALAGAKSAYLLWDEGSGLAVRVTPRGVKSWVITFQGGGRSRRLTLGRVDRLPLAAARRLAAQRYAEIAQGVDPLQEKRQKALTVAEAAKIYSAARATGPKPWKPRTAKEAQRLFDLHIVPHLGGYALEDLTRRDVKTWHASLAADTPVQAARALGWLSAMFSYAIDEEWVEINPCLKIAKAVPKTRDKVFTVSELARIGKALESEPHAPIFRLLALTGCRRDEIRTLRWADVDFERRLLHVRDAKTGDRLKALGNDALATLLKLPSRGHSEWVFPGTKGGPLHDARHAIMRVYRKVGIEGATAHHVWRHNLISHAAEMDISPLVIAEMAGHSTGSMTSRYAHLAVDGLVRESEERVQKRIADALDRRLTVVVPSPAEPEAANA